MNELRKKLIENHNTLTKHLEEMKKEKTVKELKIVITAEFINFTEQKDADIETLYHNILYAINDFYKVEK